MTYGNFVSFYSHTYYGYGYSISYYIMETLSIGSGNLYVLCPQNLSIIETCGIFLSFSIKSNTRFESSTKYT